MYVLNSEDEFFHQFYYIVIGFCWIHLTGDLRHLTYLYFHINLPSPLPLHLHHVVHEAGVRGEVTLMEAIRVGNI